MKLNNNTKIIIQKIIGNNAVTFIDYIAQFKYDTYIER